LLYQLSYTSGPMSCERRIIRHRFRGAPGV
jgi:hypothetical protein